jgi:hypothetical protein
MILITAGIVQTASVRTVCLDRDFGIKPHVERPKDCAINACIRYVQRLNPHHDVKHLTASTKK